MSRTVTVTECISRYIDNRNPNVNVGSEVCKAGYSLDSSGNLIYKQYALVRFDPSSIAGGIIKSCIMRFYVNELSVTGASASYFRLEGYSMAYGLSIETCTWNELLAYLGRNTSVDYLSSVNVNEYNEIESLYSSNPETTKDYAYDLAKNGAAFGTYALSIRPAEAILNFDSVLGANPPYMELILDDVPIVIANASPSSGFINKTAAAVFTWGISYDGTDVVGVISPVSAKFRYRAKGAGSYTEITAGATSYTLPANTLSDGNYEWQVEVTTNAGTTATSTWMEITTIDATPIATPVSPKNEYVNGEESTTFNWTHDISTGTVQTAADLQYSANGVDWLTLANVTGSANSVIIPASTFGGGNVYWRVRTYNANGIAGAWSNAAMFFAIAPVTPPVISSVTTGTARPTLTWTAAIQAGFKLEIDQNGKTIYASGSVISTAKEHRITNYLDDGNYTARMMVYDNTGAESAWVTYNFSVVTNKPTAPALTATQISKGVALTVTGADEGTTVYILRDGAPIAKGTAFKDFSTTGEHVYIARAIDTNHSYADSAPVVVGPKIRFSLIAAASNLENCVSLIGNKGEPPKREYSWSPNGSLAFYAGSVSPVYEQSQQREESGNYSFSFLSKGDFDAFMSLANQHDTVLYRDRYDAKIWAVITGLSYAVTRITYDVTFSLLCVRHKEGIDYD